MAIIGLLDWDLTKWRSPTIFNLELMKLSYYHKVIANDFVQMEQEYSSEKVTKVYVRKDYEDFEYPSEITSNPKTVWGGLALSKGIYQPLPLEIEQCPADTSIYENFFKYYKFIHEARKIFKRMMSGHHIRLTLDGINLIPNWEKQIINDGKKERTSSIIIHDKDLKESKQIFDVIKWLSKTYGWINVRLGFKFPVIINTEEALYNWGTLIKIPSLSNLNICTDISDEMLYTVTGVKQRFSYYFDEKYTEDEIWEKLPRIFLQSLYACYHGSITQITYSRNLIISNELFEVINFLNAFFAITHNYKNKITFCGFSYCKYCYELWSNMNKIYYFNYIKEKSPELFDLLYDAEYVEYKDKKFYPKHFTYTEIYIGGNYGLKYTKARIKGEIGPEQVNYAEIVRPEYLYIE